MNYEFANAVVVIVVGPDGLVANTAKYVGTLPIIGVNPDPARNDGVLLPFRAEQVRHAVDAVLNKASIRPVTMAEATLNDGQRLLAFNDFFVGRRIACVGPLQPALSPPRGTAIVQRRDCRDRRWLDRLAVERLQHDARGQSLDRRQGGKAASNAVAGSPTGLGRPRTVCQPALVRHTRCGHDRGKRRAGRWKA